MATNRRDFILGMGAGAAACAAGGCATRPSVRPAWSFDGKHGVRIANPLVSQPVRLRFIADTHLTLADGRDAEYADNYKRMAACGGPDKAQFEATLPKPGDCDLLVLGGDNVSFPTLANVEYFESAVRKCGVPFAYTAGNHDWHFEGDGGSDVEQRARWIGRRLAPLYQGRDPLAYAVTVKGLKVILIDNSVYHVTPEQLDFWKRETADGVPVVLAMHIPLWHRGWGVGTCACPDWGAANDPYWEIERREQWAERQMPSTFAFREAVMSTPSLVGVFAGHEHALMAAEENGKPSLVVPENRWSGYFDIRIEPA